MTPAPTDDEPLELPDDTEDVPFTMRSILVAEDDDELRSLIVNALRARGFAAVGVRDGRELLDQLSNGILAREAMPFPDALVTDLRMPGFSGLEVLSVLKSAGVRLPVVAITAFGDVDTHARAFAAGATVVLDKPFAIKDLIANVHYLLNLSE